MLLECANSGAWGAGFSKRRALAHAKTLTRRFEHVMKSILCLLFSASLASGQDATRADPWQLANRDCGIHRYSTLFSAQDVRDQLSSQEGLNKAIDWCKRTGVTKAYVESFRDGYQAERTPLQNAKEKLGAAGIIVSGCVTPTQVGKLSNGWKAIACYTDKPTQEKIQAIFEYAAGLFDEIMIDDFWFTDCTCPECDAARRARTVTIREQTFPVKSDSWEDYHCELMVRLSQERVLRPARRVNPRARLIVKYPQWYEDFHERGYEVIRETADFDRIWVGTETRNYNDRHWGGTPQYEGFFIMRWLGGIGGSKCCGWWFDPFGTTEATYIEQARQTILGGARESMLFCYGALQHDTGPKNIEALRANLPDLLAVANQVSRRQIVGLAAYKPANSHPKKESRVFDFVGMLGLPLVPCHEFPANEAAAFFPIHSLKDPDLIAKLSTFIKAGKPTLLTDGLAEALTNRIRLDVANVHILHVRQDPKSLLEISQPQLDQLRQPLMRPFKTSFQAPARVSLYLFKDKSWVIENFRDEPAEVQLNGKTLTVPARAWRCDWR